jgi:hypothetical protein
LLLGTHWIRVSNNDSKHFALLPIFAFDDDYVPLSPVPTPVFDNKSRKKHKSSKHIVNLNNNNNNNSVEHPIDPIQSTVENKEHTIARESSQKSSSDTGPIVSNALPILTNVKSIPSNETSNPLKNNGRSSPEVQILDITDLNDPGVRIVSKFSFKDIDNKFHITISGMHLMYDAYCTYSIVVCRCQWKSY